jgi:hypothetical protein
MTRRALGLWLCCLAVVLFLSRYVLALWYQGATGGNSSYNEFLRGLDYVGVAPWLLAAGFLIAAAFFLIRSELHP